MTHGNAKGDDDISFEIDSVTATHVITLPASQLFWIIVGAIITANLILGAIAGIVFLLAQLT